MDKKGAKVVVIGVVVTGHWGVGLRFEYYKETTNKVNEHKRNKAKMVSFQLDLLNRIGDGCCLMVCLSHRLVEANILLCKKFSEVEI